MSSFRTVPSSYPASRFLVIRFVSKNWTPGWFCSNFSRVSPKAQLSRAALRTSRASASDPDYGFLAGRGVVVAAGSVFSSPGFEGGLLPHPVRIPPNTTIATRSGRVSMNASEE